MRRGRPALVRAALLAAGLAAGGVRGEEAPPTIADLFEAFQGCALIVERDRHRERSLEFGAEHCSAPLSPCSTFKIPHALIGLETGVLTGPDHRMAWDGRRHEREELNRDHDLASAMRHSVVWYFQALARDIGPQRMQRWLAELDYGNQDLSAGIDRFWLGTSLRIDAYRQLNLLKALTHGTLPFRPRHQAQVRELLALPYEGSGALHGKTGSCRGVPEEGRPDHGWFVGWLASGDAGNPSTTWFVVSIRGTGAWGPRARAITLKLLDQLP